MYFTKTFALAFVLATGALAVPAAEATVKKPSKPALPVVINQAVQQKNSCGNDVTAYCCGNDNGGKFASCKALDGSDICSTNIVCCNAAQVNALYCSIS